MGLISLFAGSRRRYLLVLGLLIAIGPLLLAARPARAAATFTVNRTTDAPDRNLNDGVCDSDPQPGAQCTLRAAIEQANASSAADTIAFDIPGSGVRTIRPTSELPPIIQTVTIDGYSQPGSSPNTAATGTNAQLRIELDGTEASKASSSARGLEIRRGAGGTVVRGLVINRFEYFGVLINSDRGSLPVRGVRITGNFIGTNPAGTVALPNGGGVVMDFPGTTTMGGTTPADRNLISGNSREGVFVWDSVAQGNVIQGNLIGTQRDGRSRLGNGFEGVELLNTVDVTVGGDVPGAANTIAYNGRTGVQILGSRTGNNVLRNAIFANSGIGIDLFTNASDNGPTPNDPRDADTGANNVQNYPLITSAVTTDGETTVRGTLNSTPNRSFLIQVFSDPGDEGKAFRAEVSVATDARGNARFVVRSPNPIPASNNVTATATGAGGTSEFSPPVPVE